MLLNVVIQRFLRRSEQSTAPQALVHLWPPSAHPYQIPRHEPCVRNILVSHPPPPHPTQRPAFLHGRIPVLPVGLETIDDRMPLAPQILLPLYPHPDAVVERPCI